MLASVRSTLPLASFCTSRTFVLSWPASRAGSNFTTAPAFAFSTAGKTFGRRDAICGKVAVTTSPKHFPAYIGRIASSFPSAIFTSVQSVAIPVSSFPTRRAERSFPWVDAPKSRMAGSFSLTTFATAAACASVV